MCLLVMWVPQIEGVFMKKKDVKLYDLTDLSNPQDVLKEIKYNISLMVSNFDFSSFEKIYEDIELVFAGKYPGYRASNTKYHDLEHTNSVILAAVRLLHGGFMEGHAFIAKNILLGLLAALFHDIGFIQIESDLKGSGAKYTKGHEKRSIDFMKKYLTKNSYSPAEMEDCSHLIMCTILNLSPDQIPFRSKEVKMIGKIVGSADLMAQMADRAYLEKLLLLYEEFEEAGLPGYNSEFELLKKTEDFYKLVARKRLAEDFDNVAAFMRPHFKERWNIDRDLYDESISGHINYLKSIINKCQKTDPSLVQYLRRGKQEKNRRD